MFKKSTVALSVMLLISGCGDQSDSGTEGTIATGQFKDSNTGGLTYVSGDQTGVTGPDGSFTYEVGETVTFSIGGIIVGTSEGKSVVTPVDLVSEGSSNSAEVKNIVRLLMMLDEDSDPSNGIQVSEAVQQAAEDWGQVDFNAPDLAAELNAVIADVAAADDREPVLPEDEAAQAHLEATLLCSYSGAFMGQYSGGDEGNFGFMLDGANGSVIGVAYSVLADEYVAVAGATPISYDQHADFVSGNTSSLGTFTGEFSSVDDVLGEWENPEDEIDGTFSGIRIGGALDAKYRFTGSYEGDDFGLFAFDVDSENSVTGVAYTVEGDELFGVTGTVDGTTLNAYSSSGSEITGTLDTQTGELNGGWSDTEYGISGTFDGSGCQLN